MLGSNSPQENTMEPILNTLYTIDAFVYTDTGIGKSVCCPRTSYEIMCGD